MSDDRIKPCPFCGSEDIVSHSYGHLGEAGVPARIHCISCYACKKRGPESSIPKPGRSKPGTPFVPPVIATAINRQPARKE